MTNSLVQVVCNATLQTYGGDTYVGVMTIINSLREVFIMPVQGLTNGSQPVAGYNYGARQYGRVREAIRFSVGVTVAYSALFWAAAMALPGPLIRIFKSDPDILAAGVPALRIISTSFLLAGFCIVSGSVFQALGHGVLSLAVSVVRQLVVLLPVGWLLARLGGLDVVWWSFPFAELFSTALSALFLFRVYKKEVAPMQRAA